MQCEYVIKDASGGGWWACAEDKPCPGHRVSTAELCKTEGEWMVLS